MGDNELMTVEDVAKMLNRTVQTIYRWVAVCKIKKEYNNYFPIPIEILGTYSWQSRTI